MRTFAVAAVSVALAACDPQIATDAPGTYVTPVFDLSGDSLRVPTPTDLYLDDRTGLLALPADPKDTTTTAAEKEFTLDYLNTLDGYPPEAVVSIGFSAPIDPESVTETSVVALDLGGVGAPSETPAVVPADRALDEAGTTLTVRPKAPWAKGHRFVVGVRGYERGVRAKDKTWVIAPIQFALLRWSRPLATCEDPASDACKATTPFMPVASRDPDRIPGERNALARRLERARRIHGAGLDALASASLGPDQSIVRAELAVAASFRTVNQTLATFDPRRNVVPFPNDVFYNGLTVTLPPPPDSPQIVQLLYAGLLTLDGFSTTAPIVSENSNPLGAFDRALDPKTLVKRACPPDLTVPWSARLWVPGDAAACPAYDACVTCKTFGSADRLPQQLQLVPGRPLLPGTRYAAALLRRIADQRGVAANVNTDGAMVRLSVPLIEKGKSTIGMIPLARAQALEPYRQRYKPLYDALADDAVEPVPRAEVLAAWTFFTQRTTLQLQLIYGAPTLAGLLGSLSSQVLNTPLPTSEPASTAVPPPYPRGNLRHVVRGQIENLFLLDPTFGVISPRAQTEVVDFVLALPRVAPPSGRYPVVVFLHGLRGSRNQALAVADAFAARGMATLAIDLPWHGERSTCANYPFGGACASGGTCNATTGRCSSGFALDAQGVPIVSGWNFINPVNFFATRDNFRQTVADVAQLVRVVRDAKGFPALADDPATSGVVESLDRTRVRLAGSSLGAMNGVLVAAVSPDLSAAALAAPAGNVLDVVMSSQAFLPYQLLLNFGLTSQGIPPGTPQYEQILNIARWILDPGDAINFGDYLVRKRLPQIFPPGPMQPIPVLFQWARLDFVFPGTTTAALVDVARPSAPSSLFRDTPYLGAHTFFVDFNPLNPSATQQAQAEAAQWLR